MTSFPPLGLEYVAAALRPFAERIELVNFRHRAHPRHAGPAAAGDRPGLLYRQLAAGVRPHPR